MTGRPHIYSFVMAEKKNHCSRQKWLTGGVPQFSRSQMYRRTAMYKRKRVVAKKEVKRPAAMLEKQINGEKNGGKRQVRVNRLPRYYPTEDLPRKFRSRKQAFFQHKHKIRATITPGTVLILVAGRYKGKRVVFLKQLASGLLLVTGPMQLNGCPLRRINQKYVIATKTKLDINSVKIPERLNDKYFKRQKLRKPKHQEGEIFESEEQKYSVSDERKEDQRDVDGQLMNIIKDVENMKAYISMPFYLSNKQYPHKMIF
ncbi:large ribosomal subunit protein eL6-like isoform X2 [Antedon mediterranea]|uniref:large ribosomal subunit protein eL6-like isoform X2 n=1 Tax=Antedon mediterranea TaxID=105859 RepID=UPI003AF9811C